MIEQMYSDKKCDYQSGNAMYRSFVHAQQFLTAMIYFMTQYEAISMHN